MSLSQPTRESPNRSPGLLSAPFVCAAAILGVAAVLAGPVNRRLQLTQVKKELPLKAEFSTLSTEAVFPYGVAQRVVLDPVMVEALGTTQYIHWVLEDLGAAADDPLRLATLLVTYYTGGHDLVPHVPDVCYLGAGYEPLESDHLDLSLPSLRASEPVPVRVLTFQKSSIHDFRRTNVIYTFHCNGTFTATRTGVRRRIHDPHAVHAYFCKVEIGFPAAGREDSIRGAERLLDRLLPVLLRDHLPDFEAAEAQARRSP